MPNRGEHAAEVTVISSDRRMNGYFERAALFLIGIVLSLTVWAFQEQGKKIERLETTVIMLQTTKVDKADLRDLEDRINSKIDGMKSDIIQRLDLYFKREVK